MTEQQRKEVSILRLDPAILAGKKGLTSLPPFPLRMDPPGGVPHRECIFWDCEIVVLVYESQGSFTLYIDEPYPFDQFIHVLNGRTTLTSQAGQAEAFSVGESFVLPKGFVGVWQLLDDYRELCVIETKAYRNSDDLGNAPTIAVK